MRLAIMQPYFLPYIGYFQLIAAVDVFVVYDNIKYTKKGWINRNRLLQNGTDAIFSLPLKKGSDYLEVRERELAESFNRKNLLNQFKGAYSRAPYFAQTFPLLEQIVGYEDSNLFRFIYHSISSCLDHLKIKTKVCPSSSIAIEHALKNQNKVIALCQAFSAKSYVNAIGGRELYDWGSFHEHNIELRFIKSRPFEYAQYDNAFIPWLSIIDVMMFNPPDAISEYIANDYELT